MEEIDKEAHQPQSLFSYEKLLELEQIVKLHFHFNPPLT
jgi:hypothetical protein